MKKWFLLFIISMLAAMTVACSNDNNEKATDNEKPDISDENKSDTEEEDGDWVTPIGEPIITDGGTFIIHARNGNVESAKTGDVEVEFYQVAAMSGELEGEFAEYVGEEAIEYIQVDLIVNNLSDEKLLFLVDNMSIETSDGQVIENANPIFSNEFGDTLDGKEEKKGSLFFFLDTSASEVEWVEIKIPAVQNENKDTIGEEIRVRANF
ncbi:MULTISPECIES: hypothetical protein [Bacillus]|uniref:hypothetical protein n=1 Tax=Bacillus TaxID=1386 RepID=UPI000BB79088|nr:MULTISPECIES: hypothetical protein [Bacillus]